VAFLFGVDSMNFYKTKQWKRKRESILRRDEYLCQECKRYGKTIQATMVHHIVPLEKRPEFKLMSWNLISLCNKCHEAMHNRNTDELSEKGIQWVERISHYLENNPPT
jgi:5-methylcytosine-specific restriction protein A